MKYNNLPINNEILEIINQERYKKNISLAKLAKLFNMTPQGVKSKLESKIVIDEILILCEALDIDIYDLFMNKITLNKFKMKEYTFKELLKVINPNTGTTKAHRLAKINSDWMTHDPKILIIEDNYGNTVAHLLAVFNNNWQTQDFDILSLRDKNGVTVAHCLAHSNKNWWPTDENILNLTYDDGETVQDLLDKRNKKN